MSEVTQPLENDETLQAQARERLATDRVAHLLAGILRQLRTRPHPWWSAPNLRRSWPTPMRFDWLAGRPDVRGRVTHELTNLPHTAARKLERSLQVELIDRMLEGGEVAPDRWDLAFAPEDLALHAPPGVIWQELRSRFPWDAPRVEDLEFMGWFIQDLMVARPSGGPLLSPLYVRSAIDVRVWQENLPIEVRVQADARRLQKELAGRPYTAQDELAVVRVERIVQFIPTRHLKSVLDALERVLPELTGAGDEPPDLDPRELEPVDQA